MALDNQTEPSAEKTGYTDQLTAYHSKMLPLYDPVWSCDWPYHRDPNLGTLDGLEVDQLSLWQEAIDSLPLEPLLLQTLAGDLIQQGRQGEALAIYRQLVEADPENPQVLHNLAAALLICGNDLEAERCWRQVLALDPSWQEPRLALAQLLLDRSAFSEAEITFATLDPSGIFGFGRALGLAFIKAKSDSAVLQNQGLVDLGSLVEQAQSTPERFMRLIRHLTLCGQLEQAMALLEQAPLHAQPWGWDFERVRLFGLAGEQERRIAAAKSLPERYPGNAEVLANVGIVVLASDGQQAIDLFQQAIAIEPRQMESWANLALAYGKANRPEMALEAHFNTLTIDPLSAGHLNLGNVYCDLQDMTSAERCYRTTILLCPFLADAWTSLGNALHAQRNSGADLEALRRGHNLSPASYPSKVSLSLALLMHQDYDLGWSLYEGRLDHCHALYWPKGLDKWDGAREIDELLIVAEQGVGDLVQFMRYSILLTIGIPRVTILAEPKFHKLLNHYGGFSAVHSVREPYRVMANSAWYPMASILGLLGIRNDAVIIDMPYLGVDPEDANTWSGLLRKNKSARLIGLNWQGNPQTEDSFFRGRSFPLETYAPLAGCAGIQFVSLQKGLGSEQLQTCSFRDCFVDCQDQVDGAWDFIETLSILQACDLVITSDTSVAHLAGALGRPTWVLLKYVPDWRWGLEGSSTPWYPTMRLFRQQEANNWEPVIAAVQEALTTFLAEQP